MKDKNEDNSDKPDNKCSFCNKVFSNKYTLQNHISNAKYCIELRNKKVKMNINVIFAIKILHLNIV